MQPSNAAGGLQVGAGPYNPGTGSLMVLINAVQSWPSYQEA